jgi:hypothetical protein
MVVNIIIIYIQIIVNWNNLFLKKLKSWVSRKIICLYYNKLKFLKELLLNIIEIMANIIFYKSNNIKFKI